jgi:hypothetical protein
VWVVGWVGLINITSEPKGSDKWYFSDIIMTYHQLHLHSLGFLSIFGFCYLLFTLHGLFRAVKEGLVSNHDSKGLDACPFLCSLTRLISSYTRIVLVSLFITENFVHCLLYDILDGNIALVSAAVWRYKALRSAFRNSHSRPLNSSIYLLSLSKFLYQIMNNAKLYRNSYFAQSLFLSRLFWQYPFER